MMLGILLAMENLGKKRIYNLFVGIVLVNCLLSPGEFMFLKSPVYESVEEKFSDRIELARQEGGIIKIPPKGWKIAVPSEYLK